MIIHIPYWWHASLFEILWLVGGLTAGVLTWTNLRDAWKDNEMLDTIRFDPAVHRKHYEMIAISAQGRLAAQTFRLIVSGLIVFAGAVGCVTPNPLGGATTMTGFVVTLALVGISALTATIAFLDLIRRNKLYELAMGRTAVLAAKLRAQHVSQQQKEQ